MLYSILLRAAYQGVFFGAGMLLANIAGPEGWAQVTLMQLHAALLVLISGWGVETFVFQKLCQGTWKHSDGKDVLFSMLVVQIVFYSLLQFVSCSGFGVCLLSRAPVENWDGESAYFLGLVLLDKLVVLYYTKKKENWFNGFLATTIIAFLLLLLPTSLWQVGRPILLLGSIFVFQGFVLLLPFLDKNIHPFRFSQLPLVFSGSYLVMMTNIIQLLAYRLDYWLLLTWHSSFLLGNFAQASRFAALMWILPNMLAPMLFSRFGKLSNKELKPFFHLAGYLVFFVALVTISLTLVCYHFFLNPSFRPGLVAFWLMLPGYSCWAMVTFYSAYFSWRGLFKVNFAGSFLCFLLVLGADLLLIPKWGASGAAMANSIAYTLVLVYYLLQCQKHFGWRIAVISPFKTIDLPLLKKLLVEG